MNSRVVQRGKMKASLSVDAMALVMEVKIILASATTQAAATFIMWLCWIGVQAAAQPSLLQQIPSASCGACGT